MRKQSTDGTSEDGLPTWTENLGPSSILVRTIEAEPPLRLVRRFADSAVPMSAESVTALTPTPSGTSIESATITTIRLGTWHVPIFRFILTLTRGVQRGLEDYWRNIAKDLGTEAHFK
jgi:hypothetical protein